MYEHYERHRTDNITDPALRRAHPISTISGWDRDRDDERIENIASHQPKPSAITNTQINGTTAYKVRKVSKSEQTDENDTVDLEQVKCACDDDDDDDVENKSDDKAKTTTVATSGKVDENTDVKKPISSISSISQVYNETVVCNGNTHAVSSEDESMSSPQKSTTTTTDESEALKKKLEIDSHREGDDNKQIVEEIVEDILKKSESLMDDCKKSLDDENNILNEAESASSVIKDEEIELAVSEVVKGVREIEKKAKRETEKQNLLQTTVDNTPVSDAVVDETTIQEPNADRDEKTDSAAVNENVIESADDTVEKMSNGEDEDDIEEDEEEIEEEIVEVGDTANDNERIVTNIVNDVIDNCVNQTLTNNDNEKCDNDNRETSTNDNVIKKNNNNLSTTTNLTDADLNVINNNIESINKDDLQTQVSEVVNEVIGEAVQKTSNLKEANKEIVSSIVNEIVDKCVQNEANHTDEVEKPQKQPKPQSTDEANSGETAQSEKVPEPAEPNSTLESEQKTEETTTTAANPKLVRSQSTVTSTSTQVDNNQFGKQFPVKKHKNFIPNHILCN